jgi:hypothetical protein
VQAVQVALAAQVLFHRKRFIEALRLEHHAHVTPHGRGFAHHIASGEDGAALGGYHHRRQNAEERGLAAAIGAEQTEDLALSHGETDAGESNAGAVTMGQTLNFDHDTSITIPACPGA